MKEPEFKPGDDHFEKLKSKLFDEKEFNTLILNGPETSKQQGEINDILVLLANDDLEAEEKDEALKLLKEKKGIATLISAIRKIKEPAKKALLIAAFWEAGLDARNDLLFFTELACSGDFSVAMEAYTVIENNESKFDADDIRKSLAMLDEQLKQESDIRPLLEDLREFLSSQQ